VTQPIHSLAPHAACHYVRTQYAWRIDMSPMASPDELSSNRALLK
jgi:hypothetical protein